MSRILLGLLLGYALARLTAPELGEEERRRQVERDRAVEALARAVTDAVLEVEDMRRTCFFMPAENLGVVKVRR